MMSAGSPYVDGDRFTPENSTDVMDGPNPLKYFFSKRKSSTSEKMSVDKEALHYRMDRRKRGICLIFNYDSFTIPKVKDRVGSADACKRIEDSFHGLGFDVKMCKPNLTKTGTMDKINSIVSRDLSNYNCFVMFVLTRGLNDGTLFASDTWFSQEDLFSNFTADICKDLAGKPKLFFIQVFLDSTSDHGSRLGQDSKKRHLVAFRYPINADFLITYSTAADEGPCFAQSLAGKLNEKGTVSDLLSNLTAASRELGCQEFVPYTAFTLTKLVVFNDDIPQLPAYLDDDYYNMNHKRRGICLIVSNKVFTIPNVPDRDNEGYIRDLDNVITTFTQLGFETTCFEDRTKMDILTEIENVADSNEFTEDDCFAMVIMSHGREDGDIFAKDGIYNSKAIFDMFTDDKCPTLAGKPRLFFIQACKGTKLDSGTVLLQQLDNIPATKEIPIQPDFLVAYSTLPGYYAFRDTVEGSWFIQVLVRELGRSSKVYDLLTILSYVNRGVAIEFESRARDPFAETNKKKIVPYVTTRLTKLVKF